MEEESEEDEEEDEELNEEEGEQEDGGRAEWPEAAWMPLGVSSDISWERPESILGRLGNVLVVPEAFWSVLGASGNLLGPLGGLLGAS